MSTPEASGVPVPAPRVASPHRVAEKVWAVNGRRFLRVLLVRPAESVNNVVQSGVAERVLSGVLTPSEGGVVLAGRLLADPRLSPRGEQQAERMADCWAPLLSSVPDDRFRLFAGPMLRNLQTMKPLAAALGKTAQVEVVPDLFEAQGAVDSADIKRPTGLTADEIRKQFRYSVDRLPQEGKWNQKVGSTGSVRPASCTDLRASAAAAMAAAAMAAAACVPCIGPPCPRELP